MVSGSGAFTWFGVDESDNPNTACQFVKDVDAYRPEDQVPYFDSGSNLLHYFIYYGEGKLTRFRLENWKASPGDTPYPVDLFIRAHQLLPGTLAHTESRAFI